MKERIYISGAISGTDDFMERFAKAQKELESQGYSVINPALVNSNMPEDTTYDEYMKMAFTMLDMCQTLYLLNGWEKSVGPNLERVYAIRAGKNIVKQDGTEDEFIKNLEEKIKSIEEEAKEKGEWYKEILLQEKLTHEEFSWYLARGAEGRLKYHVPYKEAID